MREAEYIRLESLLKAVAEKPRIVAGNMLEAESALLLLRKQSWIC
jgi:hypothetical protein